MLINNFIKETEDGKKYIVCKALHLNKNKERVYIPIYDKHGKLDDTKAQEIKIFSGTKVFVEVTLYVYYLPTGVQGIKTKLRAIQIIEEVKHNVAGSTFKIIKEEENIPI